MCNDLRRTRGRYCIEPEPVSQCLLAGRVEAELGPFLDRRAQIPGVAREEDRHAVMILGAGRGIALAEAFELGRIVGFDPARRLIGRSSSRVAELVFGLSRAASTSSCNGADHADDPVAAVSGLKTRVTPSSASCSSARRRCFDFIGSSSRTRRRISGREARDAGDADRLALGQGVADAQGAVIGNADDVAGPGLLGEVALARQEEHRVLHRHHAAAAAVPQLHAALEAARAEPQEGDAVAMLRVDIGLHLEDEAGDLGSSGGIDRPAAPAGCGRGGGASSAMPRSSSRTPKLLSALPKKTGVRWPSR